MGLIPSSFRSGLPNTSTWKTTLKALPFLHSTLILQAPAVICLDPEFVHVQHRPCVHHTTGVLSALVGQGLESCLPPD